MNEVANAVIKIVNSAIGKLGVQGKYGYDVMNDFRMQTLTKLFDYSLTRFDPDKAQLSTFIFSHVKNEWINFQNRLIKQFQRERSMETPIGEEGMTLGETLEDPRSIDFISAQEATSMYEELKNALKDSRYQEIFRLWVDDTALNDELTELGLPIMEKARNAQQKADDIAKVINSKFPDKPLSAVRINRVIHDIVKERVRQKFPEAAFWAETTLQPPEVEQPSVSEEVPEEKEEYIPLEQRPSPAYRIDPQTGERTRIALNLRKKAQPSLFIKYANNALFDMLMTWLSIELNGKLK